MLWFCWVELLWAAPSVVPSETSDDIVIDGQLNEAAWATAGSVDGLVMIEPKQGEPGPPTVFRFLVDDNNVYVGVRATKGTGALFAPISPRDGVLFHDFVQVMFDTWQDGRRAFAFRVNARGVQEDGVYVEDESGLWMHDTAWDGVFRSAGVVDDEGYTVEMAVPLRSVRYPTGDSQAWNLICMRFTPNPWGVYTWPALTHDASGTLQQAGLLGPFAARNAGVRFEFLPTLTGALTQLPTGWKPTGEPGLGVKMGLGSAVTVDLTANPDFSQIEADDFQVTANLKYPLYLEEKRPFFLEGADLFSSPISVFYSRAVVDPLGAAKLTARAGKLSVGALSAWDETPAASTIGFDYATGDALPGWDGATVRDAGAVTSLARLRLDPGDGLGFGGMFADKEIVRANGVVLANRVGGVDATVPFADRYQSSAALLYSATELLDGSLLTGPAWRGSLEREGEVWQADVGVQGISKGFRAESGFIEEVDRVGAGMESTWNATEFGPFRFLKPGVEAEGVIDGLGTPVGGYLGTAVEMMFQNDIFVESSAGLTHERFIGKEFVGWGVDGFAVVDPTTTSMIWLGWDVGTQPHYDAETVQDLFNGFQWGVETGVALTVFGRVSTETNVVIETFRRSAFGEGVYTTVVPSETLSINLSREFSVRWRAQWDSFDEVVQNSVLLGWQRNYGTVAYLGYDETFDLADGEAESRSLFAKVGLLWRP